MYPINGQETERIQGIKIECLLTYLFGAINLRDTSGSLATITSMSNLNRHGRLISFEALNPFNLGFFLYPQANLSFKTLLRIVLVSPMTVVKLINCILLERKIIIVSPSSNLHYMRRNAILIETLMELLSPILSTRLIYLNIAYLKNEEMIDYLDSPVPFIIGMSDFLWNQAGEGKWREISSV